MENPAPQERAHRPTGIGSGSGSGSGASSSSGSSAEDKRFRCTFPGCEKRFTRAEHLHRHALNHTNGDHACPRCSAAFKRRDLLDRHMNRHRQKDLEAGGEGCGILDTRKRAWKAPDGSVAERRPHPLERGSARGRRGAAAANQAAKTSRAATRDDNVYQGPHQGKPCEASLQLPTSPISERETGDSSLHVPDDGNRIDGIASSIGQVVQQQQPHHQQHFQQQQQADEPAAQFDLFINSLVPPAQYSTDDPWQLWNEQPFQPDTASSFNMPYTTAVDYNWLFNVSRTIATDQTEQGNNNGFGRTDVPQPQPVLYPNVMTPRSSSTITNTCLHPGSLASLGSISSGDSHDGQRLDNEHDHRDQLSFGSPGLDFHQLPPTQQQQQHQQPVSPKTVTTNSINSINSINNINNINANLSGLNTLSSASTMQACAMQGQCSGDITPRNASTHHANVSSRMEHPLSRLDSRAPLPIIDGPTHERLLTVISNAKPCLPDSTSSSLQEHPLLSQTAMQSYLDCFFTRFNVAYPIIHTASFSPSTAEPLLLLSIILLGATYAAKDAHQVAVCIHDVIRPSVFAHEGFSARPALWTLQTILLVECFGKSRAGQKQHDMSHLFHGLLINLIRRSDSQSVRPPGPPAVDPSRTVEQHKHAVEQAWHKWAEAEQKKRLALYCFMWDTQHAVLFCQSLCMSAFELRLNFPCNQHVWEAESSSAWEQAWLTSTPQVHVRGETGTKTPSQPFYLPTLRAYLTPNGPPAPAELNLHGRVLVLHGLMSIFWDMQRRDQTSLGASVAGVSNWRLMIHTAYENWKRDFDSFCSAQIAQAHQQQQQQQHMYPSQHGISPSDLASEISVYASAANAVYHAAQCLLRMEFLDIQIYAGARSILGRPVQQRDYLRSAQVVKQWASSAAVDAGDEDGTPLTDRGQTPSSTAMVSNSSRTNALGQSDATGAVWHAARMLRDVVPDADAEAMASLFHVPWCLYLATLTCWAFYHASPRSGLGDGDLDDSEFDRDLNDSGEADADEMVWDSRAEMSMLIAGMTASPDAPLRLGQRHRKTLTRRRTNGLVWVMADTLTKVRWGIVHAGVIVLRGLVPARLINQYEAED